MATTPASNSIGNAMSNLLVVTLPPYSFVSQHGRIERNMGPYAHSLYSSTRFFGSEWREIPSPIGYPRSARLSRALVALLHVLPQNRPDHLVEPLEKPRAVALLERGGTTRDRPEFAEMSRDRPRGDGIADGVLRE